MRILYITFESPSKFYGGGKAIIQSLESLSAFAEIDYVGLPFDLQSFPQFNIKNHYFLTKKKNPFKGLINIFRGVPTFLYASWKKIKKRLQPENYDLAFIEFSNIDFAVKWAKENNLKTVVRAHNVEYDIVCSISKAKRFDYKKLRATLNKRAILKRERRCLNSADKIIFLTQNDFERAQSLYKLDLSDKCIIVPICMHSLNERKFDKIFDFEYALATGSLNYAANVEGIVWFIKNVWTPYCQEYKSELKFVVAGSKPSDEFIKLCNETANCVFVNTPDDLAPYLEYAKFYIAPIFVGAGMKVKVSEALSHGLNVIGTAHAFIGYESMKKYLYFAQSAREFTDEIVKLSAQPHSEKQKEECKAAFKNEFTLEISQARYKAAVNELLEKEVL